MAVTRTCRVVTPHATRYLGQLCKHFAHKIEVIYDPDADPTHGLARFAWGICHLRADEETLHLIAEGTSVEDTVHVARVIDDHLIRFAWREDLSIDWSENEDPDA